MKILITGANGFIAQHIVIKLLENTGYEIIATSKSEDKLRWSMGGERYRFEVMDICDLQFLSFIERENPDVIIHAAAMGSADECELDREKALNVNVIATRNLADAARRIGVKFIFLSTDFVFDGKKGSTYLEEDVTCPVNYYGQTKVLAEDYIIEHLDDYVIIRLCAVYGDAFYGKARGIITMTVEKLSDGKCINVVGDQIRTPTYVGDIAVAIERIIRVDGKGVFHVSGNEIYTPYEMAVAAAEYFNLDTSLINKGASDFINEPATRPRYTGFVIDKAVKELDFVPTSLVRGIEKMNKKTEK